MDSAIPRFFSVKHSNGSYDVIFDTSLDSIISQFKKVCVICDQRLAENLNLAKEIAIITIEATENNKNLLATPEVILELKRQKVTREYVLIAIGGGIIQDIACFVASIYMRGISWVYIPTTLLGIADSCIGGKSSINVGDVKNLVGTFWAPLKVYIIKDFIKTLSTEQIVSGLFEAIKIIYTSDDQSVASACKMAVDICQNRQEDLILDISYMSLTTKKNIIEIDEFDKKERLLLNFGHTFGHAIESACNYEITHGIAVGIGMLCAINLSENITGKVIDINRVKILQDTILIMLKTISNMNYLLQKIEYQKLMPVFKSDKKHMSDSYYCILIDSNGFLARTAVPRSLDDKITNIFEETINYLKNEIQ